MSKWNKERFSVYTSEEKNVLGLLKQLGEYTNKALDNLENKTDLMGDHKGSWQGLSKPTLSEEGMRATVEKLQGDYTELETNINNLINETEKIKTFVINSENPPSPLEKLNFDGSDESKKLQAMIDYLVNNYNGGKITFPSKKLVINKTVSLPLGSHSITLEGTSFDVYNGTIFSSNVDITILNIDGYNHKVSNIAFTNSLGKEIRGRDSVGIGIFVLPTESSQSCDSLIIENCSFFRLRYGILNKSQNIYIKNNLFSYIKDCAFESIGKTNFVESGEYGQDYVNRDIEITHNRFHGLNNYAIMFDMGQMHKEILISNNIFDDTGTCIIGTIIRSNICNNVMGRVRGNGIYIDNKRYDEPLMITNNTIIGISKERAGNIGGEQTSSWVYEEGDGISVSARSCLISNNVVAHKAGHGIIVNNYSEYTIVTDNIIVNADNYNTNTKNGITINSGATLVKNNSIRRTTTEGKHYHSIQILASDVSCNPTDNVLGTCSSGTPFKPFP